MSVVEHFEGFAARLENDPGDANFARIVAMQVEVRVETTVEGETFRKTRVTAVDFAGLVSLMLAADRGALADAIALDADAAAAVAAMTTEGRAALLALLA